MCPSCIPVHTAFCRETVASQPAPCPPASRWGRAWLGHCLSWIRLAVVLWCVVVWCAVCRPTRACHQCPGAWGLVALWHCPWQQQGLEAQRMARQWQCDIGLGTWRLGVGQDRTGQEGMKNSKKRWKMWVTQPWNLVGGLQPAHVHLSMHSSTRRKLTN